MDFRANILDCSAGERSHRVISHPWFIYLLDRFADSVSLRTNFPKSIRQQVCFDHRNLWMALILIVGILDGCVIFARLDFATTFWGLVLGTAAFCYLILNW